MLDEYELTLVLVGFMIAFLLAFGIGANDVANTFGTSVGAKVLSLRAACWLASICELTGAILLGGHVSKTIKDGIVDTSQFNNTADGPLLLMQGQVSSLAGAGIWMLIATFFHLPVSGTHSIVGATAGYGLVQFGLQGIKWMGLLKIVLSWFISPVLSGIMSFIIFFFIKRFVLSKERPLEPALLALPFIFGCTIIVNVFSILYGGIPIFNLKVQLWVVFVASFSSGLVIGLLVYFLFVPFVRKQTLRYVELLKKRELEGWEGTTGFNEQSRLRALFKNAYRRFLDFLHCRICHKTETVDTESGLNGPTSAPHISRGIGKKWCEIFSHLCLSLGAERLRRFRGVAINLASPEQAGAIRTTTTTTTTTTTAGVGEQRTTENTAIYLSLYGRVAYTLDDGQRDRRYLRAKVSIEGDMTPVRIHRNEVLSSKSDLLHQVASESTFDGRETSERTLDDVSLSMEKINRSSTKNDIMILSETDITASEDGDTISYSEPANKVDRPEEAKVFSYAQILTATFGSFVHGGNDVSNAIGPLIGLWTVSVTGSVTAEKNTPIALLVYGGFGISVGLWVWGRRVIQTIGEDLTKMSPSSGVSIELGSAVTALVASKVGIPVSTTHCQVGSVVSVGLARSRKEVNWKLFISIFVAWMVTLPVSAAISALVMYAFTHI